jgi:glycosyltransferase involved in cell wall biosynthesis
MRYAYIKYGDVVDELNSIGPSPKQIPKSGPTAFMAGFLHMVGDHPALVISWGRGDRDRSSKAGKIEAFTYKRPKGLLKFFSALKILFQLLTFRPQVVLCVHDGPGLWAALIACRFLGAAFIHSRQRAIKVQGDSWRRRASAMVDGYAIRRAGRVICHGPFARRQLLDIGVSDSRIIEFDVRFDDFMAMAESCSIPYKKGEGQQDSGTAKILFLGRVEASKGVFELLEACTPLLKARSNVDMTFIGQGAALSKLQQLVENTELASRITFTGAIAHDQVGIQLKSATVLVTPTQRGLEGWPMAALEGLTMGVPVIAPAAGPFLFMIKNGINGLHYEDGSVMDLQKKIVRILDDPELRHKLSRGAIEVSSQRAKTIKDFGSALSVACNRLTT